MLVSEPKKKTPVADWESNGNIYGWAGAIADAATE